MAESQKDREQSANEETEKIQLSNKQKLTIGALILGEAAITGSITALSHPEIVDALGVRDGFLASVGFTNSLIWGLGLAAYAATEDYKARKFFSDIASDVGNFVDRHIAFHDNLQVITFEHTFAMTVFKATPYLAALFGGSIGFNIGNTIIHEIFTPDPNAKRPAYAYHMSAEEITTLKSGINEGDNVLELQYSAATNGFSPT